MDGRVNRQSCGRRDILQRSLVRRRFGERVAAGEQNAVAHRRSIAADRNVAARAKDHGGAKCW